MNRKDWRDRVALELRSCGVVDAHNHILGQGQRSHANPDLFDWITSSYYLSSLLASGMSTQDFCSQGRDDSARRWRVCCPYLKRTRNCSYALLIDLATRDLFDLSFFDLDDHNWKALSDHFQRASQDSDWFEAVLGRRMGLKFALLDLQAGGTLIRGIHHPGGWYDYILHVRPNEDNGEVNRCAIVREIDTRFMRPVFKIDSLIYGYGRGCHTEIEQLFGVNAEGVSSLSDYLDVVDRCFENIVTRGGVGIKSAIMGLRTLQFPRTNKTEAEKVFVLRPEDLTPRHAQDFENYLMHVIVQKCIEHHLPLQIHTGMAFGGHSSDDNGRAGHLFNLVSDYPEARFDLLHGGFPYADESSTLASRFPNVYLNFSYFTMLAPSEARRALASWLEMVPMHKFSWGSDCSYVEETYGAFLQARLLVADGLWEKVEEGWLSQATGLEFVRAMFYDNPVELFRLSGNGVDEERETSVSAKEEG